MQHKVHAGKYPVVAAPGRKLALRPWYRRNAKNCRLGLSLYGDLFRNYLYQTQPHQQPV
jgi:hypothetical protein